MPSSYLEIVQDQNRTTLIAKGDWVLSNAAEIESALTSFITTKQFGDRLTWDFSQVDAFDSAGVLLYIEYNGQVSKYTKTELTGLGRQQEEIYTLLTHKSEPTVLLPPKRSFFEKVGRSTVGVLEGVVAYLLFFGTLFAIWLHTLVAPSQIRWREMVYHIYQSGAKALVIIGLTSFLVGMVIAYQGAVQLAKFGADIFIVDTLAISMTRELGPMVTAIVIAGRSGSAYTAEIGAMKITEEISAMRTMGFDPYRFLVLPRIFALMISLPLLIFFADMVGIFGGMVAAWMQLGISTGQFIDRLYEVLEVKHYLLGMLKGPVFAFLIASVGCFRGFQVSGNTESIGLHTTASVVNGIFLVIAFDALFSVIYTEMGL